MKSQLTPTECFKPASKLLFDLAFCGFLASWLTAPPSPALGQSPIAPAEPAVGGHGAPRVVFLGPQVARSRQTEIQFRAWIGRSERDLSSADEPSPPAVRLSRIECYAAKPPGKEWFLAGAVDLERPLLSVTGTVPVTLADGNYKIALIARGGDGKASSVNPEAAESTGRLLVDRVPPQLQVVVEDARDLYSAGEEMVLVIRVEDPYLSRFPVSLTLLRKEGDGWRLTEHLEPYFPEVGRYVFRTPARMGAYLLRATAADVAGNASTFEHPFFVVPPAPQVWFTNFTSPTYLRGGDKVEVRWGTRFVGFSGRTVDLELSRDGGMTWKLLAADLENSGFWEWKVPREDFQKGRLRLKVESPVGQVAHCVSAPLVVSTRIPRVRILTVKGVNES